MRHGRGSAETHSDDPCATIAAVFTFSLVDEDGDVQDPAGFLTAVLNWTVSETFLLGRGDRAPAGTAARLVAGA
jgi:hypothetical protein